MSNAEQLEGRQPRRERIKRWMDEHAELDSPATKGKLIFDIGRSQRGEPEVSVAFHPASERL